jgi:hypothetical protein
VVGSHASHSVACSCQAWVCGLSRMTIGGTWEDKEAGESDG